MAKMFVEINNKWYNKSLIKSVKLREYSEPDEETGFTCSLQISIVGEKESRFERFKTIEEGKWCLREIIEG